MSHKQKITVFTDGSCSNNGKKNACGGIGIHFPDKELKDVSKTFTFENCTNQRTELYAILIALKYINKMIGLKNLDVLVKTDSEYSINCITKWVDGWIKNGWKTVNKKPVANREFIEPIHNIYLKYNVSFQHVSAHMDNDDDDSIANNRADLLATRATQRICDNKKNNNCSRVVNTKYTVPNIKHQQKKSIDYNQIKHQQKKSTDLNQIKHQQKKSIDHNQIKQNFSNFKKGTDFEIELIKK